MYDLVVPDRRRSTTATELSGLHLAYSRLLRARQSAFRTRGDALMSPVPVNRLVEGEEGQALLRWMQFQGHVEHLRLFNRAQARRLLPQIMASVIIVEDSAFALTDAGERFAKIFLEDRMDLKRPVVLARQADLWMGELCLATSVPSAASPGGSTR